MKKLLILLTVAFMFTSCTTEYIYVQPEYPKLKAPTKVEGIEGAFIRNRCLWINDHNTNLCNEDLEIVLGQIEKFRVNENACEDSVLEYNVFVDSKKESTKK